MGAPFRSSVLLAALAALSGCGGFPPQSEVHGLRVLAVRPDPASGSPGATIGLDLLVADARRGELLDDGTRAPVTPPVQVGWLGGCHNPPSRQYYACFPILRTLAADPAAAAAAGLLYVDTLDPPQKPGETQRSSSSFAVELPDDILSAAPRYVSDAVHFGVSFVFFAACAGRLTAEAGGGDTFPFACLDEANAPVGPSGFVIGFSTIYTYEGEASQNHSPVLTDLAFDGRTTRASTAPIGDGSAPFDPIPCTVATELEDCKDAPFGHPARCSENQVCAPFIGACSGKKCPSFRVVPALDPSSVEPEPGGGNEIMWASYYATRGSFDNETRLIVDRDHGLTRDFSAGWKPPEPAPNHARQTARLWVTVNDQRAGATWAFFDVVVE